MTGATKKSETIKDRIDKNKNNFIDMNEIKDFVFDKNEWEKNLNDLWKHLNNLFFGNIIWIAQIKLVINNFFWTKEYEKIQFEIQEKIFKNAPLNKEELSLCYLEMVCNKVNLSNEQLEFDSNRPIVQICNGKLVQFLRGKYLNFTYTWNNLWENPLPDTYTFWHNLTESQKNTITNVLSRWESPVTAEMIADSCRKAKTVPVEYLLWFMQNDSRVWTMWLWARTHNPGNVWNTGKGQKDWWTWKKGVEACANNLEERINGYTTKRNQIKEEFQKYLGTMFNEQKFNSLFSPFPTPEQLATWTLTWTFRKTGKIDNDRERYKKRILTAFPHLKDVSKFTSGKIEERAKEDFPLIKTLIHGWSIDQSDQEPTLSTPLGWFNRYFWIYMSNPSGPANVSNMVKTRANRI